MAGVAYSNLVILLHGLGSDGKDMREMFEPFRALYPEVSAKTLLLTPDAPIRTVRYFGGQPMRGWSDIFGLDIAAPDDWEGFEESRQVVEELITSTLNVHPSIKNIILGGFSQGAALTYCIALQSERPELKAAVIMSGWLPARETPLLDKITDLGRSLPILQIHGTMDQMVPLPILFQEKYDSAKLNLTMQTYPCEHTVNDAGLRAVYDHVVKHLQDDEAVCNPL